MNLADFPMNCTLECHSSEELGELDSSTPNGDAGHPRPWPHRTIAGSQAMRIDMIRAAMRIDVISASSRCPPSGMNDNRRAMVRPITTRAMMPRTRRVVMPCTRSSRSPRTLRLTYSRSVRNARYQRRQSDYPPKHRAASLPGNGIPAKAIFGDRVATRLTGRAPKS